MAPDHGFAWWAAHLHRQQLATADAQIMHKASPGSRKAEVSRRREKQPVPRRSIMIIDDHPATRRALALMLESQGYAVEEVATTTECLTRLDAGNTYDLLIIDIVTQEPGLQGLKLGQAVKRRDPTQKLIYLSGFADVLPKEERESAGAPVLAKPMRMSELMEHVRNVLGSSG